MSMRVCVDCHRLTKRTRCPEHERAKDKARGTREERGYGAEHKALRAHYQHRMDQGEMFVCWRCAEAGTPHDVDPSNWHLGHDDEDRTAYRGPECPAGNLATSGRYPSRG